MRREPKATSKVRENRENKEREDGEFFQNALSSTVKQGRGRLFKLITVITPVLAIIIEGAVVLITAKGELRIKKDKEA